MSIIVAIIIFSVIVLFHEFGHFIFAKTNGVGVIEFSLGMGPRLITYAKTPQGNKVKFLCSGKYFEEEQSWQNITKYSIKLLPLGGSCAMVGEDDESDAPDAFGKKKVWQRFLIVFGGPFFNFVLAFIFSIIIIANTGVDMPIVTYIPENTSAYKAGIREGDTILEVNGRNMDIAREITTYVRAHPLGTSADVKVKRGSEIIDYTVDTKYVTYIFGINYGDESTNDTSITGVSGAAKKAGLKEGDKVKAINGKEVSDGKEMSNVLVECNQSPERVDFFVDRDGEEVLIRVTPEKNEAKTLGFVAGERKSVNFLQNIKYSLIEVKYWIVTVIESLRMLITRQASVKDMSGPVGIVSMIGNSVDSTAKYGFKMVLMECLYLAVLLSANLGVMNLLPIPALDGGRIVFLVLEAIRRKPIDKEKEAYVHFGGFVLLMLLMVFIMFNDIVKLIK